jgi:membrane protease YdiL (CAAX protease family)
MKVSDEADEKSPAGSTDNGDGRKPDGKKRYIVGLTTVFVCSYVQYLGYHFGLILGPLVVYGVPILVITLLWGTTITKRFFKSTYSALKLGLGFFGAFTVLGILLAVVMLLFLLVFNPSAVDLLNRPNPVLNVSPNLAWIMVVFSVLVVGPAEEYVFRGFMFGRLLEIFKNHRWFIVAFISSLLFGAVHLYYAIVYGVASLVQFTDLVTFGMAMAATYHLSGGNLFVPSLIHGVYDATAFVGVANSSDIVIAALRGSMILIGIIAAVVLLVQKGLRRTMHAILS